MNKLFYFLTLIFLIFLFSCSGDENTTRKVDFNPDVMPDQNGIDIKVVFTDSTQKKAVLYAGLAEIYNKRKELYSIVM
jgi:hypothetical protein